MIFSNTQTAGTLKFIAGTFNIITGNVGGPWASGLVVQYTLNGSTWQTATGWTLSPSYSYTNTTAGVEYTFTGTPLANVKGMRVSGRTWQSANPSHSRLVRVREVKVFANQNAVGMGAGKVWAKLWLLQSRLTARSPLPNPPPRIGIRRRGAPAPSPVRTGEGRGGGLPQRRTNFATAIWAKPVTIALVKQYDSIWD